MSAQKIVTIEPGLEPAALGQILVSIQQVYETHKRYGYDRPRVRGLAGGQIAVYAGGLRS